MLGECSSNVSNLRNGIVEGFGGGDISEICLRVGSSGWN